MVAGRCILGGARDGLGAWGQQPGQQQCLTLAPRLTNMALAEKCDQTRQHIKTFTSKEVLENQMPVAQKCLCSAFLIFLGLLLKGSHGQEKL